MKRAMKVDDFLQLEVISDPQHRPNDDGFAYIKTEIDKKETYYSNIYYYDEKKGKSVQWTYGKYQHSLLSFSPDGKSLAFQSNRSGSNQIWLLPLTGGEAEQLTTFTYGASGPIWSADGRTIYFTASLTADSDVSKQEERTEAERKEEQEAKQNEALVIDRLQYKSDAAGFIDHDKTRQIIKYTIATKTFEQVTSGDKHHHLVDVSPDGASILFIKKSSDNVDVEMTNDVYQLHLASGESTKLTASNLSIYDATYAPNGKQIVLTYSDHVYKGATLAKLSIFDIETSEQSLISEAWDIPVGDFLIGDTRLGSSMTGPIWSADSKKLYFIGTNRGSTQLYEADIEGNLQILYDENNHLFGFTYDKEKMSVIAAISTPTDPGNFYRLEKAENPVQLTNFNEQFINDVHIEVPSEENFTMEDGTEVQGWLLKPYGYEAGKKYPFILEIHGGPHMMYGQSFFHEMQLLAAKGYVVLYTNPRGSHGYGQSFVDAVRHHYGEGDYTDLMTAVDHTIKKYEFIDEDRLGVTGGSYGGFMTNWIVSHTNRFKAAVTQRSIANWLSFYGVSDIGYFFNEWEHGLNLLDDPKKLWDISPLKYAADVETPLLILHGELDYRCPIEQGEQLFVTLKHLGKDVRFVRFPNANHELSRSGHPKMRMQRLEHIANWFETYL